MRFGFVSHALIATLRDLANNGVGVVLVLHDLAWAMNHADRVLVLDRGALVAQGPPAEVLAADVIARVWGIAAHWLGEPGARWNGSVRRRHAGRVIRRLVRTKFMGVAVSE